MKTFRITLSNNATLTGRYNLPPSSSSTLKHRPIIVGLHGGSYGSTYFDVDERHTATLSSNGLGVPFVAIDRPCYGGSTSFYPIPDNSSFPQELGTWLHQYILPTLWAEFGESNNCNCIVLDAHSLGVTGAVIAAAMHAQGDANVEKQPYPLGGVIVSGFGTRQAKPVFNPVGDTDTPPTEINFPLDVKDKLMLPRGTADLEIYKHTERLNEPLPIDEITNMQSLWMNHEWRSNWAANVKVPVMIGISGRDCFWEPTEEHLREFIGSFPGSMRVEGSIVTDAPHCIELSYWSQGWYGRCFGFAMECAVILALSEEGRAGDS